MPLGFNYEDMSENDLRAALPDSTLEEQIEIWKYLSKYAWERREYGSITAIAQNQYDLAIKNHSLVAAARAKYSQGGAYFNLGEFESAKKSYLECADLASSEGLQALLADALLDAADSAFSLNDYNETYKLAVNALEIATAEEVWSTAGKSASLKMKSLYYLDKEEEALAAGVEARNYFRNIGDLWEVIKVDDFAITILIYLNEVEQAVELAREVLLKVSVQDALEWLAYSNFRLGTTLQRSNKVEESNHYLDIAKNHYIEVKNIAKVAECDFEIANNFFELDKFEEAIEKLMNAKSLWDGVGNDWGVIRCNSKRAVTLHMLNRNTDAKKLNLKILTEIENVDSDRYKELAFLVRARAADNALNEENYTEVLNILNEKPELGEYIPSTNIVIWRLTLQARALYHLGREDEALVAANSAMDLTDDNLLNWNSGFIYEVRGNVLIHKNRREGEKDLAHAIALHLGNGYTDRAAELSKIFIPKIQRRDVDSNQEIEVIDGTGESIFSPDNIKGEVEDIQFGFN